MLSRYPGFVNPRNEPHDPLAKPAFSCYLSLIPPMSHRPVHDLEARWQAQWELDGVYRTGRRPDAEPFFGLVEFPFPSGDGLHVGHVRSYVAIDAYTRRQRMLGKDVLYPIGWDAFGLPTENYALKNKIAPSVATAKNVANFTRQFKSLGVGFDWSREINTTDPAYYKWTQWQFLQFVKHGMAYKAASTINWCLKCKIGLANEEAQGGVCERCGNPVEKREKSQWMIRITSYAERLLQDLDGVDYLDKVKAQQRNWIGKSAGAHVSFALRVPGQEGGTHAVTVFTTRPDTIFGVTFLLISPELAKRWMEIGWQAPEGVKAYVTAALSRAETERSAEGKEKTGVETGILAVNPVDGREVPVWVADYVLGNYGTGAVMAVPGHDERDFAFATAFGLPVTYVVAPMRVDKKNPPVEGKKSVERQTVQAIVRDPRTGKILCLKWKEHPWTTFIVGGVEEGEDLVAAARREIREETGYTNPTFRRVLGGPVHAEYFAAHKDENRIAHATAVLFDLEDDAREDVAPEELAKHEPVWLDPHQLTSASMNCSELDVWLPRLTDPAKDVMEEEGVAVHSGRLTGLPTWKAKEDMLSWLEEKGVGTRATTYKLRDWVFSRQRYWGEPIPLVHCPACAAKTQKVLLVHGYAGGADKNWFPWMKARLEAAGFEVLAPTLPDPKHPDFAAWMDALVSLVAQLGPQDVVVAHSMGGKAAIHALARAKVRVGHLLLVASSVFVPVEDRDWERLAMRQPGMDVPAVKAFWSAEPLPTDLAALAEDRQCIVSSDDPLVPAASLQAIPDGWFRQVWEGFGHFQGPEYPELLARVVATQHHGWMPLPESSLPLTLPPIETYEPSETGESPLAAMESWVKTSCPACGGPATRETDTMPNWAGSSWYFLRYTDPKNDDALASPEALRRWMPVDLYDGGMEHTTLHLLYSRFWHKFLWDAGILPREIGSEPYQKRRSHGLVLAAGGEKMSKSKGNVVNPDDVVAQYGADVLRVYELFMGPFDQPVPWDTNGIEGVRKFLDRVWNVYEAAARPEETPELRTLYHQTIKKLTEGIDGLQFNTCVSQLMILVNGYQAAGGVPTAQRAGFLQVLAPLAPHLAEELWRQEGNAETIHLSAWPAFDARALEADTYELVVQVNGKVRAKIRVSREIDEEGAKDAALNDEAVRRSLEGRAVQKAVFVKGRLLSLIG